MNTGFVLGARVAAHVTAAGMLLLALREEVPYAHWLQHHPLRTYTQHTVTDKKEMAAFMAQIKQQDWALSEQQLELNYRGIAVPLRDAKGMLMGALSVTTPMSNESTELALKRVLGVLQDTAASLRNLL
jgi:IclR family transcriptional regulator, pca regulon regulatory protein